MTPVRRLARSSMLLLVSLVVAATVLTGASLPATADAAPTTSSVSAAAPDARHAPGAKKRTYWAAIAISRDNAAVTVPYRYSKAKAKKVVVRECKRISNLPGTCRWVIAYANQCAAVAVITDANGYVTTYRAAAARTQSKANRKAVRKLGGGRVRAGSCTPRG